MREVKKQIRKYLNVIMCIFTICVFVLNVKHPVNAAVESWMKDAVNLSFGKSVSKKINGCNRSENYCGYYADYFRIVVPEDMQIVITCTVDGSEPIYGMHMRDENGKRFLSMKNELWKYDVGTNLFYVEWKLELEKGMYYIETRDYPDIIIKDQKRCTYTLKVDPVYKVLLNANGGGVGNQYISVVNGKTYGALPDASRLGYTFTGWYTEKSGGTKVTASSKVDLNGNQTLYAHWENKTYTVTFNGNKGKLNVSSKSVAYDKTYGTLATPTRKGYKFKGWYTAKQGGTKITSSTIVKLTKNQTLYAQWGKIKVKKATVKKIQNLSEQNLKVTVKALSGVSGYEICYGTNSKVTKGVKKTTTTGNSVTFSNLKKKKTYYVKVRAYTLDSAGQKVYGAYSSVKKIKIKK